MGKDSSKDGKGLAVLRVWKTLSTRRIIWGVIFFAVSTVILSVNFWPQKVNLQVGEVSSRQIKSPQSTVYISDVLTQKARSEAAVTVDPIFKIDQTVIGKIEKEVDELFGKIAFVKEGDAETSQKVQSLQEIFSIQLGRTTLDAVLNAEWETITRLENETKGIIQRHMQKGVQQEALETTREAMVASINELGVRDEFKPLLMAVISEIELQPNLVPDIQGTQQKRNEAMKQVEPIQVTIRQGEKIIGDGEVVTEEKLEALRHLGLLETSYNYLSFLGLAVVVAVIYILVMLYLYRYNREVIFDQNKFLLLGLLIVVGLFTDRCIIAIKLGDNPEIASLTGFMVPTAAVSMLVAVLLDRKLALFITMVESLFVGILMGYQLHFALVSFVGGTVGVYSVSEISERTDLTRASVYIVLANIGTIVGIIFLRTNSLTLSSVGAVIGLINGVLSSVLTIGALPFLENSFGITTSVRLLELANPNQPILKRLLLEAPGTYHHSIMVPNLGEGAADATGANPLLTRVGAYYHDIGKLKRPYFFIENQLTTENPHDKLSPNLSTLIITAHIKDGLELARENNLPQSVIDIIDQHHGTGVVTYFYRKALESEYREVSSEADFRYEGPKPRTKEAAIVMLADSVEAAVRSMKFSGHGRLEACVRRIVKERLEDGQLEESELTFKELEDITRTFVRILGGIFHSRIEYPDAVLQEMEGRKKKNGDNNKQRPAEN